MLALYRTISVRRFVSLFLFFLFFSFSTPVSAAQMQMLQFGSGECPVCSQIQPKINEFLQKNWPIQFIDVTQNQNRSLAQQFQIQAIPTFVLLVDSREVGRFVAPPDPENVHQQIIALFKKGDDIIKTQPAPQSLPNPQQNQQPQPQQNQQPGTNVSIALTDIAPPNHAGHNNNLNGNNLIGQTPPNVPYTQQPIAPQQPSAPRAQSGANLISSFLSASVRLRINDPTGLSTGTGTIVETGINQDGVGEALVLTCGHIFRETQGKAPVEIEMFLSPNDGTTAKRSVKVQGSCFFYDRQTDEDDIAFVKFDLPPNVEVRAVRLAPQDNLQVGQKLLSVGCDAGADPTIREHRILTLDKSFTPPQNLNQFHYIQVSGAPIQGRSGGGLFSAEGFLVGVCNTGDPGANDGLFVPLSVIRKQLDRLRLSFVYQNPSLYCPAREPQESDLALASTSSAPLALMAPVQGVGAASEPFSLSDPIVMPELGDPSASFPGNFSSFPSSRESASQGLSLEEKATVEEIRRRQTEGAEIILIVNRPGKGNAKAKSEIIKLESVSDQFMDALTQKAPLQSGRPSLTEQAASLNRRTPATKQREAGLRTPH